MLIDGVTAILLISPDPVALAEFYRSPLGARISSSCGPLTTEKTPEYARAPSARTRST